MESYYAKIVLRLKRSLNGKVIYAKLSKLRENIVIFYTRKTVNFHKKNVETKVFRRLELLIALQIPTLYLCQ